MAENKPNKPRTFLKDLSGKRFARLTVIQFSGFGNRTTVWDCLCECGQRKAVTAVSLVTGNTKSCGCLKSEYAAARFTTHGMRYRREYNIWLCAKNRCSNPHFIHYSDYGGRGITMCKEWRDSFEQFFADMGPCPPRLSLDRRDNESGYSKQNCRWATIRTQNLNQRRTVRATHNGETLSLSEWAERTGIPYMTLYSRHKQNRPIFAPRYKSNK